MAATAVLGAIAAIGTGASIENSAQSRRLAGQAKDRAMHDQTRAQQKFESDAQRADIQAAQDAARVRQKGVKSDRASTILSGPNGAGATSTLGLTGGKTLLGS